ncbi:hypothetical protein F5Y16DRAFT_399192 [Xylariaceae sp. FL0255]|nr:hypothetical protein F5Y16DRAFT_399192 [Xylariaceae sp. FL0255]
MASPLTFSYHPFSNLTIPSTLLNALLIQCCKKNQKKTHKYSSHDTCAGSPQLQAYMDERNGGGDPVTALGVRGASSDVNAAKAQRQADVQQSLQTSLAQYYQAGGNQSSS